MPAAPSFCLFCGRLHADCPGGLWNVGSGRPHGICKFCARAAIRAFGEAPDPRPAAVVPLFTPPPGPEAAD